MYSELLERGKTDLYHAGEWACIDRVLSHSGTGIVAKSSPSKGTLNSTFSLYVRPDSGVDSPKGLANKPVAVEPGTGSYYTALQDLEEHLPRGEINLVQGGEPHSRLLMLVRREAAAASLVGPWVDLAEALGMKVVLKTKRTNPTTAVMRRHQSPELAKKFFEAVNSGIRKINDEPEEVRDIYFRRFSRVLARMPREFREAGAKLRGEIRIPRWEKWRSYTKKDFERAYAWMVERGLARVGAEFADVSIPNLELIFPRER